jgi:hypothetical protein
VAKNNGQIHLDPPPIIYYLLFIYFPLGAWVSPGLNNALSSHGETERERERERERDQGLSRKERSGFLPYLQMGKSNKNTYPILSFH